MIGLCGAHRTGKTTLAKAFAEKSEMKFVQTSASGTFQRLGYSPREEYSIEVRLEIQTEILNDACKLYSQAGEKWITDRTPIDFLGYTMADVTRSAVNSTYAERVFAKYVENCIYATNRYFSTLVLVQPGITVEGDDQTKAQNSAAYIEHLNSLMLGLISDPRITPSHFYIPRATLDLNKRVRALAWCVNRTLERHSLDRIASIEAGESSGLLH